MAFCRFGKDYIKDGYTQIDNIFLASFLPAADAVDCKVYLYGMFLASFGEYEDNSIEKLAIALKLNNDRVMSAYNYWQEQGLVSVSRTHPIQITYHSVKAPHTPAIKINAKEYAVFVEEMARLFPEKVLTPNEITNYIELMKQYKIETNAMLMIAKYCMDFKATASTAYILAVAADWAKQNIISEAQVDAHIEELENNNEDVRAIMRTLGLKSTAGIDERQLYLRWTKDYAYQLDAILVAARSCKRRGGMDKLARVMDELYNAHAITAMEVSTYIKTKQDNENLSLEIVKMLGTYYSSFEMVIEVYILPWKSKGFDDDALRTIAKFCFIRNVRTLDAMDTLVEKFYKLGLLSSQSIENYIDQQVSIDNMIKEVLSAAGTQTFISNRDREFYRTFADTWGFSHDAILAVAKYAVDTPFPMTYINKQLATLKGLNIFSVAEIDSFLADYKKPADKNKVAKSNSNDYIQQTYTREQLTPLFSDADDLGEI